VQNVFSTRSAAFPVLLLDGEDIATMAVIITGERELELKFDNFPREVHSALEERITAITENLRARVEAAAPRKTGLLRSEIKSRVYSSKNRIAGYVSVYAPGREGEYAKAATLEYGTDKPRHAVSRIMDRMGKSHRRIMDRISKPVHIEAYRYLRGPFADLMPEIQSDLESVVSQVTSE
jgi:hypothetical protein